MVMSYFSDSVTSNDNELFFRFSN